MLQLHDFSAPPVSQRGDTPNAWRQFLARYAFSRVSAALLTAWIVSRWSPPVQYDWASYAGVSLVGLGTFNWATARSVSADLSRYSYFAVRLTYFPLAMIWLSFWYFVALADRWLLSVSLAAVATALCARGIRFEHEWDNWKTQHNTSKLARFDSPMGHLLESVATGLSLLAVVFGAIVANRLGAGGLAGWREALLVVISLITWRLGPHSLVHYASSRRWLGLVYSSYFIAVIAWTVTVFAALTLSGQVIGWFATFLLVLLFFVGCRSRWRRAAIHRSDQPSLPFQPLQSLFGLSDMQRLRRATAANQRALDHARSGSWQEACDLVETAFDEFRFQVTRNPALLAARAAILGNLGCIHSQLGNWVAAEDYLRQAIESNRLLGESQKARLVADSCNLAELYLQMGFYDPARAHYDEAFQSLGGPARTSEYVAVLRGLADVDYAQRDFASAERRCRDALAICEDLQDLPLHASVLHSLGMLSWAGDDIAGAVRHFSQSLDILARHFGKQHPESVASLCKFGQVLLAAGNLNDAEAKFTQARDILSAAVGQGHREYVAALKGLSLVQLARGNFTDALSIARQVTALDDRRIGDVFGLGTEVQRAAFLESIQESTDLFLSVVASASSLSPSSVRGALDLVLRRKALGAEAIIAQRKVLFAGRYPELAPQFRRLNALRMQIAAARWSGPRGQSQAQHERELSGLNAEKQAIEKKLAGKLPEMNLELHLREADSERVAARLPRDSALVEFVRFRMHQRPSTPPLDLLTTPHTVYAAMVLPAGSPEKASLVYLGTADVIDALIVGFRAAIAGDRRQADSAGSPDDNAGDALRATVLDPVIAVAGAVRRLFIAPDGDLNRLPFEALPSSSRRWILDDFEISYLSTGRDLLRFDDDIPRSLSPAVVLADPDFDLGEAGDSGPSEHRAWGLQFSEQRGGNWRFRRLPGTREEGIRVAERLGGDAWLGEAALESRLKKCHSPWIIHLATHGFFLNDPTPTAGGRLRDLGEIGTGAASVATSPLRIARFDNPLLRSGVVLSGANLSLAGKTPTDDGEDGLLTAEDVSCLDLLGTELVVLSACETGLGEVRSGEGVYGLRRAFVLAGARTIVMSLWKVPDLATAILMDCFYENLLGRRLPRHQALRDAQRTLRELNISQMRDSWLAPAMIDRLAAGNRQLKHEMLDWLTCPDDHRPFFAPLHWGAFICQGCVDPVSERVVVASQVSQDSVATVPTLRDEAFACLERGDIDAALKLFSQVQHHCRKSRDRQGQADALLQQARIIVSHKEAFFAIPTLYEAEKLYQALQDDAGLAMVQILRAEITCLSGRRVSPVFGNSDFEWLAIAEEARNTLERLKCAREMHWAEQVIARIRQRSQQR